MDQMKYALLTEVTGRWKQIYLKASYTLKRLM
jgi:hypothetical protein